MTIFTIDDFLWRALLASVLLALAAAPLGCFVLWRRMVFFGDTLAHSTLLGAALALLSGWPQMLCAFAIAWLMALLLTRLSRLGYLGNDAALGLLSQSALALGLLAAALMPAMRQGLPALLLGDILSVTWDDLAWIAGGCVLTLLAISLLWRTLLAASLGHDLARIEGLRPERAEQFFTLLLALVIASAMKIAGALLIAALLTIPAASARRFAQSPEGMALWAALFGVLAAVLGLAASLVWDAPSGPAIILAAALLFALSLLKRC